MIEFIQSRGRAAQQDLSTRNRGERPAFISPANPSPLQCMQVRCLGHNRTAGGPLRSRAGSPDDDNGDDFCHIPPPYTPSRPKPGTSWHRQARGDHPANQDPTSSETSASSSDTDSDSDPDSDDLLPSSSAAAHALALSDRSYADLCRNIVLFAYPKFLAWSASARYMAPPEQRVRARTTRRRRRETDTNSRASAMSATATAVGTMTPRRYVEEAPDPSSPHVVIISPIDGYYHLACPFYRANPARHGACVVAPSSRRRRRGLQSVPDVVRHVVRHHRKPASCPVCSRVFASELAAEAHVRALSCKAPAVLVPVEGVTYRMAAELARQQRRDAGSARGRRPEADRWRRVFATVLPGADADQAQHAAVCSPYLTDGLGLAVSLLRDYWSAHGYECIAEYLAGRDDGQLLLERDSDALAALDSGVFEDLLAKVVGEHAE